MKLVTSLNFVQRNYDMMEKYRIMSKLKSANQTIDKLNKHGNILQTSTQEWFDLSEQYAAENQFNKAKPSTMLKDSFRNMPVKRINIAGD